MFSTLFINFSLIIWREEKGEILGSANEDHPNNTALGIIYLIKNILKMHMQLQIK